MQPIIYSGMYVCIFTKGQPIQSGEPLVEIGAEQYDYDFVSKVDGILAGAK